MPMGKKQARLMTMRLKEIHRIATMKTACFDMPSIDDPELPKSWKDVTSFIRRVTRLWRASWITDPLQEIINELEKHT